MRHLIASSVRFLKELAGRAVSPTGDGSCLLLAILVAFSLCPPQVKAQDVFFTNLGSTSSPGAPSTLTLTADLSALGSSSNNYCLSSGCPSALLVVTIAYSCGITCASAPSVTWGDPSVPACGSADTPLASGTTETSTPSTSGPNHPFSAIFTLASPAAGACNITATIPSGTNISGGAAMAAYIVTNYGSATFAKSTASTGLAVTVPNSGNPTAGLAIVTTAFDAAQSCSYGSVGEGQYLIQTDPSSSSCTADPLVLTNVQNIGQSTIASGTVAVTTSGFANTGSSGGIATVTLSAPGTGYTADALVTTSCSSCATGGSGATFETGTVSTTGPVSGVTQTAAGTGYSVSNNDSTTCTGGGCGTGATVDITAISATAVSGVSVNAAGTGYLVSNNNSTTCNTCAGAGATINITTASASVVSAVTLGTAGSGYSVSNNDNTTCNSCTGTGATIDITSASPGVVSLVALGSGGSGYSVSNDDSTTCSGCSGAGATVDITSASLAGAVSAVTLTSSGTGYSVSSSDATTCGSCAGTGATINITAATPGVVSAVTISAAGTGYSVSNNDGTTCGALCLGTGATIDITSASATVASAVTLGSAGTGYSVSSDDGTTCNSCSGTGAEVNITGVSSTSSGVSTVSLNAAGNGYTVSNNDSTTCSSCTGSGATIDITSASGTVASAVTLTTAGSGYSVSNGDSATCASCGGSGALVDITAVSSGVSGVTLSAAGSGYSVSNNDGTTCSGCSGTGATIDIVSAIPAAVSAVTLGPLPGLGYSVGLNNSTTCNSCSGTGATINITSVLLTIIRGVSLGASGGSGYVVGDVLTIVQAGGVDGEVTVSAVSGGTITGVTVGNSGGTDYAVGDVLAVVESGGTGGTVTVSAVSGGTISAVTLASGGTGFAVGNVLSVVEAGGTGGTVTVSAVTGGAIASVSVGSSSGNGYAVGNLLNVVEAGGTGGSVTVSAVSGGGITAVALTTGQGGSGYSAGDVLTVAGGGGLGGTVTVSAVTGGAITDVTIGNSGGSGYIVGNVLTVAGGSGNGKVTVSAVSGGAITGVTLGSSGGTGYTVGNVLTVVEGGGANGTVTVSAASGGAITGVTIGNSGGSGYSVGNVLVVAGGASGTVTVSAISGGAITGVSLGSSGGTGYAVGNVLTVVEAGVANATVTVSAVSGGGITAVSVGNSGGSGYAVTNVLTVAGGGGNGMVNVTAVSGGVITGVTLGNSGGTGYAVGKVLTVVGGTGGTVTVSSISGAGTIATVTLENGGQSYSVGDVLNLVETGASGGQVTVNTIDSGNACGSDGTTTCTVPYAVTGIIITPLDTSLNTAVKMSSFRATESEGGNLVQFKTGLEVHSLGFNLYREAGGQRVRLNSSLLAGTAFLAGPKTPLSSGYSHSWVDKDKGVSQRGVSYLVEEIDLDGTHTMYGPVGVSPPPDVAVAVAAAGAVTRRNGPLAKAESIAAEPVRYLRDVGRSAGAAGTQVIRATVINSQLPKLPPTVAPSDPSERLWQQQQLAIAAGPAVKIGVESPGWYVLSWSSLLAAGLDPSVNPSNLQLYRNGVQQAILVTPDTVEFYGSGLDTEWSGTQAYWLVAGSTPGERIAVQPATEGGSSPSSFPASLEWQPRTLYFAALLTTGGNNIFGPVLMQGAPVSQTLNLTNLVSGVSQLQVTLQGASSGAHSVDVALNGTYVGTVAFGNMNDCSTSFAVPPGVLAAGANTLTLTVQGGSSDVSVVDTVVLTYPHSYNADSNLLEFTVPGGGAVNVGGFTSNQIRLMDVSDPEHVIALNGTVGGQGSGLGIAVTAPAGGTRTLLAFTSATTSQPASIENHQPTNLHSAQAGADMVMISHTDFISSLAPLEGLRVSQGHTVAIVNVENIYDEFNFGNKSPYAIKSFLINANTVWTTPPHWVLLVGDATEDPRNYLGTGLVDYVPTMFVNTALNETSSDDWFVDYYNTGLPDVAMGRLVATTPAEASLLVNKIIAYEGDSGAWKRSALLVAGVDDSDDDFTGFSTAVQALLPSTVLTTDISVATDSNAHTDLLSALNSGVGLVNYTGHGSTEIWEGGLFSNEDATGLVNGSSTPLVLAMTCLNGSIQDVYDTALAKALVKAPTGGAVAVWASSALTNSGPQAVMNQAMIQELFGGPITVGEAVMAAKKTITDMDVRRTWILLGDPAMRFQ